MQDNLKVQVISAMDCYKNKSLEERRGYVQRLANPPSNIQEENPSGKYGDKT